MIKYTIADFRRSFPDERACLEYIFKKKYPDLKQYYYVKGRKCFANPQGKQIHPVKGTIFEHSSTPLTLWFYAIFLFSVSRNGVASRELQRQLGVTLKTAWRMGKQIRALMTQGDRFMGGTVEMDETYFGGKKYGGKNNMYHSQNMKSKSVIIGAVERKGEIRASVSPNAKAKSIGHFLDKHINPITTRLMTDSSDRYHTVARFYDRKAVNHRQKEYVRGEVHTNTIEGFWGQFKTCVRGTYVSVSKKHLQSYVDEFAFRRNHRLDVFEAMVARI